MSVEMERFKMKKLLSLVAILGLFLLSGCEEPSTPIAETPNTMHPAIVVDGDLYYTTGLEIPIEPGEEVIQEITRVVDPKELPKEEGEINFPVEDAKYAKIIDGEEYVVVLISNEWVRFEKREEETDSKPETVLLKATKAQVNAEDSLGVSVPVLDYASDEIIIFHGHFGLFVYDLNTQTLIQSLDLEPLECNYTQGSNACMVSVSKDGEKILIHPMESEMMYEYEISSNQLSEVIYMEMEDPFEMVPIEEAVGSGDLGKLSVNAAKFENGEYGYLHAYDWTLGTLSYVRSDMMYALFVK